MSRATNPHRRTQTLPILIQISTPIAVAKGRRAIRTDMLVGTRTTIILRKGAKIDRSVHQVQMLMRGYQGRNQSPKNSPNNHRSETWLHKVPYRNKKKNEVTNPSMFICMRGRLGSEFVFEQRAWSKKWRYSNEQMLL